ncbi:Undecaprenyl-phosphate mannosyltransferase [Emticicia aquatica]|uniref:Undecaprenyl-phosphate mannosyltransferase n=1 Tax=Emticicia aquatica TaxID=1681835 RepID=A0ABN8EWD9_9BACT|nr:glycosyltransferase family 2 protein [Emticicia aquatica]CAH0995242.1 Undecaprenyl-phosphate mannosyltransferase [Emticicia aquatica]
MLLSVLIPAYNEVNNIQNILTKIGEINIPKEIIIVDDGSTDGTRELLAKLKSDTINVILHKKNQGKGGAIKTAISHAKGDIIIIQDADLEYDPKDYYKLIPLIKSGQEKVVYGSRFLNKQNKHSYFSFFLGGQVVTWITNILYGQNLTDEPTCYKVFDAKLLKSIKLNCTGFEFCPEVTAKIAKLGYKIPEVPINYYPRSISEGKKINWKDGVEAIWVLLKYRFVN